MKKIIAFILSAAMLLCSCITASATSEQATLAIGNKQALPGDTVTIDFVISGFPALRNYIITDLEWDEAVFSEPSAVGVSEATFSDFSKDEYGWSLSVLLESEADINGVVMSLTLKVSETASLGKYQINANGVFQTSDLTNVPFTVTAGSVDVVSNATTSPEFFDYTDVEGGVEITGYTGSDAYVYLPGSIDDKAVVSISESAFEANTDITKIVIPASVTSIGDFAFYDCTALLDITVMGDPAIGELALGYYFISRREDGIVEGVILNGWTGGKLSTYATDNGLSFVGLEKVFAKGYQKSTGDNLAIRFVGEIGFAEYYESAGLDVVVNISGGQTGNFTAPITTVYKKLIANVGNGTYEEVTSDAGNYLMARSIYNLPKDRSITFTITPYVVNLVGVRVNGETVTVNCDAGIVSQA